MFVRQLKGKNGKTYIQVVDKSSGKYKVLKSIGSHFDQEEIKRLIRRGDQWIKQFSGKQELDFTNQRELFESYLESIENLKLVGLELVLGKIFDEIGFNKIEDEIFRQLVIYRLAFPKSKLKTTEYLYRYQQLNWNEDQVYRYLDKLHSTQKDLVQQISYEHTLKVLDKNISIVFYDVTTLYFEIEEEDELRRTGFSKDGKHQNPQIVLGLLVSKNGYPLAYDIFEGKKFEGHTMLPVVESFRIKYKLEQLVVIADAGLLSSANIEELKTKKHEFILGARIKNEKQIIREKILNLGLKNGESAVITKGDLKLIITFSKARAEKDKYNRQKGLRRLEKQIKTGKLTKAAINNRGYNKYLKLEGEITVAIDQQKYEQDAKWDGLKGYITNSKLNKDEIIENYNHLWHIESAFRITKSELKVRPVYHRLPRRIEAHICIAFVAYKIYKELERQLKGKKATISATKAIEIAENIFQIQIRVPTTKETLQKVLLLTEEQKYLASLLGFGC
jgi:transposase